MQVHHDAKWTAFDEAMKHIDGAVRLKKIRAEPITRGRAELHLFELAPEGERPHPRLRMAFTEVVDPAPPALPEPQAWPDPDAFRSWLVAALSAEPMRAGLDQPPEDSPHYWHNSLRAGRVTALLDHARAAVEQLDAWSTSEREAGLYAIAELGALAYADDIQFDDENTGTYHQYKDDKPFVHVLERLHASLPEEHSEAFVLLPSEQQYAIRRQTEQLRNHLDFLMRHKYAFAGITETDIERTLGGFLMDRETRQIASENPDTRASLRPRHQLLRIDPSSDHEHAGAWLMRVGDGLALRDGTPVEVDDDDLRKTEVPQPQLTFARAPKDPLLREGVRFDWDSDGWVDAEPIPWIAWAGHCDVKAVLEAIGLALLDQPSLFEYRSDTGQTIELTRDLLLELLTAVVEFGSVYQRMDGTGEIELGIHQFGGARNDSLPDRLQFAGADPDQHFRWPLNQRRDALEVTKIVEAGETLELGAVFSRYLADPAAVEFSDNPRYVATVDGDYNVIDATGMVLSASTRVGSFDADGQVTHALVPLEIDLRPEATGRTYLGTELHDAGERELFRVFLDREQPAIVAELWRWDPDNGQELHVPDRDISFPLASPLSTTLSREQKLDDPAAFEALIGLALQRGQNICADTDENAPVWNGVVTRIISGRYGVNEAARTERWRMLFIARFGFATLEYMVRRTTDGTPETYCPIANSFVPSPDFLWQDLPDIASKGVEQDAWVVNDAMLEREVVKVHWAPHEQGGWYVEDDHIKNAFELLYAALAGYRWTIVHQNKRYVFTDEAAWTAACSKLDELRAQLSFDE